MGVAVHTGNTSATHDVLQPYTTGARTMTATLTTFARRIALAIDAALTAFAATSYEQLH